MPSLIRFGQLIRQNISYYITSLLNAGFSFLEALNRALDKWTGFDPLAVQEAALEGQSANKAGGILSFYFNKRIGDQNVPINPNLPNAYRYVGQVNCKRAGDESSYLEFVVFDSDERLTFEQLDPILTALAETQLANPSPGKKPKPVDIVSCDLYTILSVERQG